MRRTYTVAGLALSCACLAGCAGPQPLPLPPPPVEAKRRPALAIAPLLATYETSANRPDRTALARDGSTAIPCLCGDGSITRDPEGRTTPCPECDSADTKVPFYRPYKPFTDGEGARARAGVLLEQRGLFEKVVLLPSDDPRPEGLDPAQLRQVLGDTARAKGARFLLEATIEDARVELIEKNGWHVLKVANLIVSSILIFPAVDPLNWVIPGEDYGVVQWIAWRLVDLETDAPMGTGRVQRITQASFNDFGPGPSRGFFIVGVLRAPGCLDEEDWVGIHAQLADVAAEDLAGMLVVVAEEGTRTR